MLSGIWDKLKGVAVESWEPMASAYDNAMTDEELTDLGSSDFAKNSISPELAYKFASGDFNETPAYAFEGNAPTSTDLDTGSVGWQGGAKQEAFIPETYEEAKEAWGGTDWSKIAEGLSAAASTSGKSTQMQGGGGGGPRGGGTNIQVEDQYAAAMKALVEKYGKFMFNENF